MYLNFRFLSVLYILVSVSLSSSFSQNIKVVESTSSHITVEFDFNGSYKLADTLIDGITYNKITGNEHYYRYPGEPWLPVLNVNIGIPHNSKPTYKILWHNKNSYSNKFILPYPETDPLTDKPDMEKINRDIYSANKLFPSEIIKLNPTYTYRYIKILPISISAYQFNPVTRQLLFTNKVTVRIDYNTHSLSNRLRVSDAMSKSFLESAVINADEAKGWISQPGFSADNQNVTEGYWYNPNKNYYKLFLKNKGVYRVTYGDLISAGVPLGSNTALSKIELFNHGESIPLDIIDTNSDSLFNESDYFQFVGSTLPPSPYASQNIYNLSNVYWFSYESDSTGNNFIDVDGIPNPPNYDQTFLSTRHTLHFEKDSIYERLGRANSGENDFWLWGRATAQNRQAVFGFEDRFDAFPNRTTDSAYVSLRVQMHGMTTSQYCNTDHKAEVFLTDQFIGDIIWDGQEQALFEKDFYISGDSIRIFPTGNRLTVWVRAEICEFVENDEIRINWYEFEYWRDLRTNPNNFIFKSHVSGNTRFWTFGWLRDNMKIYIPEKNKMISNPVITNDPSNSVVFVDTANIGTEYYCVSDDYFLTVDSIVQDKPSDIRDISNEADYIIITHPDFNSAAQTLAQFRSENFPDTAIVNARVKVVDVMQIYDEFSYGLLDPYALQYFVKYAFENWQSPAPSYVVLMGDMSYDYRGLLENGSPNFIPSIPIFAFTYGQAISDNMFVAVAGDDIVPDLAVGRLSCETLDEANLLVNKIINYPADNTKAWKENVLLLASGLNVEDENIFGFNDASLQLGNTFVTPFGYNASYVFNFATKPEHLPYEGGQLEMREELSKSASLVNYYGHGGGSQWDLVFTDDDIDLLENDGRLPVILSVTCYTAHFDNQKIFGERFNLAENKGSIGFYGSTGLTFWGIGKLINNELFEEIFINGNLIIGKAILNSKNQIPTSGLYGTQLALLTYLGDPAMEIALPKSPDFAVNSNDITLSQENPTVDDSVLVKININNFGRTFPDDSVVVELSINSADTNFIAGSQKLPNFGDKDSVLFSWSPSTGNLYELTAEVNETEAIFEEDHSDNVASQFFLVFNINEPSILKPIDGFSTSESQIKFVFSDLGYYIDKNLSYFIEIDTTLEFVNPIINSGMIISENALVEWSSSVLPEGTYFWRARISDGSEFGNWSTLRSFSIGDNEKSGYYAHERILKSFTSYNINYSDSAKSLRLNTELLPARPFDNTFLEDIYPQPSLPDSLKLTTLTTDGTYFYFGIIKFFANGKSAIYRIGTGHNGTVKGQFYGQFSNFYDDIENAIVYHSDGYLYVANGNPYELTRISVSTEAVDTIPVPAGLLRWDSGTVSTGAYYLTSDGNYIYNLASIDSQGNQKYTLRTFDPANGFSMVGSDLIPPGESFEEVSGFFVFGDYFYPVESFFSNRIRRIRLSDGFFAEEWVVRSEFESYYSWCSDWTNNTICAGVYRASGFEPKISTFFGNYIDASGTIITNPVGPVAWWKNLSFDMFNPSLTGEFNASLLGFNSLNKIWDTLQVTLQTPYSLTDIDAKEYPKVQIVFTLTDSSFTNNSPIELKNINIDYQQLTNVMFFRDDLHFSPDSTLQGFPVSMRFKARNFGELNIDSLDIKFYLTGLDSLIYSKVVNIPADSVSEEISYTIATEKLLFDTQIRAVGSTEQLEYFSFDNLIENQFFVVRDSVWPEFNITFDGVEIIDGDIVSAKPDVMITLQDNSPLPLDTSFFEITLNESIPLYFAQPELSYEYTPYPNSRAEIHWTPELPDGDHILRVNAKDASNNPFDSTSSVTLFSVFNEFDLTQVFNYPNPFTNDTHFTFELRGSELPDRVNIKVYTIAGRLIWDYEVPASDMTPGFNKIYWSGKDQDGDDVANGVYLYKVIAKFKEETKSVTQKLARVR